MINSVVFPVLLAAAFLESRPVILDQVVQARDFQNADIHLRCEDKNGWIEYRTRTTECEILNENCFRATLVSDGILWSRTDSNSNTVMLRPGNDRLRVIYRGKDLRYIGLGALWFGEAPELASEATSYSVSVDGDLTTVTCSEPTKTWVFVFNARQANSLVAYECHYGRHSRRADIINAQYDGIWFPRTVMILRNGDWVSTTTVLSARLEADDLPATLSPKTLEVGLGTNVRWMIENRMQAEILSYDGTQIVPYSEAAEMRKTGRYSHLEGDYYEMLPSDFDAPE